MKAKKKKEEENEKEKEREERRKRGRGEGGRESQPAGRNHKIKSPCLLIGYYKLGKMS